MAQTTPIPQSQDDADIVAPIVAEQTADDATRAAIVEQLAETESADKDDNTRQVLPFITRLYGGLVMLLGVCTIPLIIYELAYGIRQVLDGNVTIDALALPFILSCVEVVVLIANAACMAVFGVQLLRSHRRHAARWAYALMPLTLAHGMLSLALEGFGQNLLGPFVQMAILVALSVTLDPALLQERQLQWHLKRMDEHDAYNRAVQADMLGRDQSGKGYISLDFFNIFWLFVVGCVVGLAHGTIFLLVSVFGFGVPFTGSVVLLYVAIFIFSLAAGGIGLMISSLSSTQQQAFLGAFTVGVPCILLSGAVTPVINMPMFLQHGSQLNPIRHFTTLVQGVFLRDITFEAASVSLLKICAITVVCVCVAVWMFRRRV